MTVLTRPSSDPWRIRDLLTQVETSHGDLAHLNAARIQPSLADVRFVFHLAAAGVDQSNQDAQSLVETNVLGTLRLLKLARDLKVERFVSCGSCLEYGSGSLLSEDALPQPSSVYGASKSAAWLLAHTYFRQYSLPVVSLRPFTVYGPLESRRRLIPHAILNALDGANIELTGGEQARDFVYVEDVVEAFLTAAVVPEAVGGTFNLCTGTASSVREVVRSIIELTGSSAKALHGALPYRSTEIWVQSGNPVRAEETLGWEATTSIREGLDNTIRWLRENRARYAEYDAKRVAHD